jgi:hypothetical protein
MQSDSRKTLGLPRPAIAFGLVLALAGCGIGRGFSGSGDGFGGFGVRPLPVPEAEAEGYTMRRLRGQPDDIGALQADPSIRWPFTAEDRRASAFEAEEEQRQRLERERQQRQTRGSSTGAREVARPPEQVPTAPLPRAPAPAPEVDQRGQPVPFAPPGTVVTGGAAGSRTGTFGGPAGTGTIVRDGGTNTLMGADGTIRTVPTPR